MALVQWCCGFVGILTTTGQPKLTRLSNRRCGVKYRTRVASFRGGNSVEVSASEHHDEC